MYLDMVNPLANTIDVLAANGSGSSTSVLTTVAYLAGIVISGTAAILAFSASNMQTLRRKQIQDAKRATEHAAARLDNKIRAGMEQADRGQEIDLQEVKRLDRIASRYSQLSEEVRASFRRYQLAFAASVLVGLSSAMLFLYGTYLALTGEIPQGVVAAVSSGIPGATAAALWRSAKSAETRSDTAFESLRKASDADEQREYIESIARSINLESADRVRLMTALTSMFPNSGPSEIASLMSYFAPSASGVNVQDNSSLHVDSAHDRADELRAVIQRAQQSKI